MNVLKSLEEEKSRERERQKLKEEIKKRLSNRRLDFSTPSSTGTSPIVSPVSSVRLLLCSSHYSISYFFCLFSSFYVNVKSIALQLVIS
jgi:hypothetical protein